MMVYLGAAFGLAYIVGHSTISLPFRTWLGGVPSREIEPTLALPGAKIVASGKPGALGPFGDFICSLLECPACFGFWTGLFSSQLLAAPAELHTTWWNWPVVLGCLTAGSNFAVSRLTRLI